MSAHVSTSADTATKSDISLVLERAGRGEPGAYRELVPLVYEELRRRARQYMAEHAGHNVTLQPTALVHEAFLKLVGSRGEAAGQFKSGRHFLHAAAEAMRQILVNHAKAKAAAKRGGRLRRVELEGVDVPAPAPESAGEPDWLALNSALAALEREDEQAYRLVMLRYFAGRTEAECATMLGVSERTVQRSWRAAKLFLLAHMSSAARGTDRNEHQQ